MTEVARTGEEILERIENLDDPFGFKLSTLLPYLSFEHAQPFLKEDVTEDDWPEAHDDPVREAYGYLDFAWDKADNERGISASRSVDRLEEWLWLSGMDEELEEFQAAPYEPYGKPKLKVAEAHLTDAMYGGDEE